MSVNTHFSSTIMSNVQNQQNILLSSEEIQKARALVAEENEDNRFLLTTLLSMHEFDVVEAQTADDAIEIATQKPLDLILIDMNLPQDGGIETTRRMRELMFLQSVPIIVLSSYAQPIVRMEALAAGCDDYIIKPFDIEQLINVVERQMKKKKSLNFKAQS